MKTVILLCCICTAFIDPSPQTGKFRRLDWLLGNWQMKTEQGTFMELWSKSNDSTFSGQGFFISSKGDTAFRESLSIVNRNDILYYIPVIENQNDGKAVYFKERFFTDKEILFENMKHDFPQRITYTRVNDHNIIAKITGIQKGKERTEQFNMIKVNDR